VRADKKRGKRKKRQGKRKKIYKMIEKEQCFIKLRETSEKMQAIGEMISYRVFFPLSPNIILIVK
jgi:hypothetical protein